MVAASTVYGPSALTTQADAGTPPTAVTFSYTGAAQSWTVPAGVTSVQVDLRGAQGQSVFGGLGGETIATIPVTPGQNLGVYVGGTGASGIGGWNGGGGSSFAIAYAAGGRRCLRHPDRRHRAHEPRRGRRRRRWGPERD